MKRITLTLALFLLVQTSSFAQTILLENNYINQKTAQIEISLQYPTVYAEMQQKATIGRNFTENITSLSSVVNSANRWIYSTIVADVNEQPKNNDVRDSRSLTKYVLTAANRVVADNTTAEMPPVFQYTSSWSAFSNSAILSIFIKTYLFTGGANGPQLGHFATFDTNTGCMINLKSSIPDTTKLLASAVKIFCKERKYPTNATIEQTGLFCKLADLPMPKNMGLNSKGLELYYNMYEIAPRYLGAISITIPYDILTKENLISLPENILLNHKLYYENYSVKKVK